MRTDDRLPASGKTPVTDFVCGLTWDDLPARCANARSSARSTTSARPWPARRRGSRRSRRTTPPTRGPATRRASCRRGRACRRWARRSPTARAANGTDIDDCGVYTWGHPGAQLFPAVLAMGESLGIDGRRFLDGDLRRVRGRLPRRPLPARLQRDLPGLRLVGVGRLRGGGGVPDGPARRAGGAGPRHRRVQRAVPADDARHRPTVDGEARHRPRRRHGDHVGPACRARASPASRRSCTASATRLGSRTSARSGSCPTASSGSGSRAAPGRTRRSKPSRV